MTTPSPDPSEPWADRVILRTEVGSTAHGTGLPGGEDYDELGVMIEPWQSSVGLGPTMEHVTYRPGRKEGERSQPGDYDLVVYSARKFARLAAQGNPSVLMVLFGPLRFSTPLGDALRDLAPAFYSDHARYRFLGYAKAQRERLLGVRGGAHTNRPELVDEHGYDCYLDDTDFLTRRGWMRYDQIDDGEALATVNPISGQVEFQHPIDRVSKPYSGTIVVGRSNHSAWAVTANHRMLISKVERGPSGRNGWTYHQARASWSFQRADAMPDGKTSWHVRVTGTSRQEDFAVEDAYLSLMGAFVSEGCAGKRLENGDASVLRFEQKDGGRLHPVMEVIGARWPLRSYKYAARPVTIWTLADRTVARSIVKECGAGVYHKMLPEWVNDLSTRQANILLDAMIAGDGTNHRSGGWVYYTASRQLADQVQALAIRTGRRSSLWGPYGPMYQVRIADGEPVAVMAQNHLTTVEVDNARVVCFTVPNETLVTRRQGKVAMHGNTKYAMHMLRLGYQGLEYHATGRLELPIDPFIGDWLRSVRRGEVLLSDVLAAAEENERCLAEAAPARKDPDVDAINGWLLDVHRASLP